MNPLFWNIWNISLRKNLGFGIYFSEKLPKMEYFMKKFWSKRFVFPANHWDAARKTDATPCQLLESFRSERHFRPVNLKSIQESIWYRILFKSIRYFNVSNTFLSKVSVSVSNTILPDYSVSVSNTLKKYRSLLWSQQVWWGRETFSDRQPFSVCNQKAVSGEVVSQI